jgi:outer membrane protein assembly factor BamD (BamD/ComL family)
MESLGIQKLAGRLIDEVYVTSERRQTPVFKPLNVKGDDSGQFVFRLKQADEARFWAQCLSKGSISAFREYLTRFPNGVYTKEAGEWIKALAEESEWEKAAQSGSVDALLDFLEEFPQTRFRREAREKIEHLEDLRDWQSAAGSEKIADYLEYKEKHPSGKYVREADERIAVLRSAHREAMDFPRGRYRQEAEEKIEALEQVGLPKSPPPEKPVNAQVKKEIGKDQKVSRISQWLPIILGTFLLLASLFNQFGILGNNRELMAYNEAVSTQSIPAIENFLKRYPEGKHAAPAMVYLKSLEEKLEYHVQDASVLIEAGLFKDAMALLDTAERINPGDIRIQKLMEKAKQ